MCCDPPPPRVRSLLLSTSLGQLSLPLPPWALTKARQDPACVRSPKASKGWVLCLTPCSWGSAALLERQRLRPDLPLCLQNPLAGPGLSLTVCPASCCLRGAARDGGVVLFTSALELCPLTSELQSNGGHPDLSLGSGLK